MLDSPVSIRHPPSPSRLHRNRLSHSSELDFAPPPKIGELRNQSSLPEMSSVSRAGSRASKVMPPGSTGRTTPGLYSLPQHSSPNENDDGNDEEKEEKEDERKRE